MALVISAFCVQAQGSDSKYSFGVHASTLGLGFSAGVRPVSSFGVRAKINFGSYAHVRKEEGKNYDVDLKLGTIGGTLDWHVFDTGFRLSIGGFFNKNAIDHSTESKRLSLGHTRYAGTVTFSARFKEFAPYVGIGSGFRAAPHRPALSWESGILFQGAPVLVAAGRVAQCQFAVDSGGSVSLAEDCAAFPDLKEDAAREHLDLLADAEKFSLFPVLLLSLGFRF